MKIGTHEVFLKPINPKPVEFDKDGRSEKYVNLKGEQLKKMVIQKAEYKWINSVTNAEHDTTEAPSKSFNGQPVGTQEKTKATEYEETNRNLIFSYAKISKSYQVVSATLKEELKNKPSCSDAITFQYNAGRNYVPDRAIVYYDKVKDIVIMRTVAGDFSKVDFTEEANEKPVEVKEKAKPLQIQI